MKWLAKILNTIYCLTVLLFLLDCLTSFDIKNQALKTFAYFGFLFGTPAILLLNIFSIKIKTKRIIGTVYPAILLILILVLNPMKILFAVGAWRTQTILYQNGHFSFKKIEFQVQDVGALGYNKRTVEVAYLTPLFMIVGTAPNNIDKRIEWIKFDKPISK